MGLVAGGVLGLVLLIPLSWFGLKSGRFALADSTGLHLYQRAFFQGKVLSEEGPNTRILLQLMDGADPRVFI